ncbi:MAG: ABC transporter permease [Clostridia bacterium]|nr:ABC transporter permease [Clostridia bacterium]MDD4386824.1 ABC transporter permease [Clostridia bacterium]
MKLIEKFKEIYKYRHMLYTLVKQDIRGRYKGSFLGFLWTLLNPLLLLLVYSTVFQIVFKIDIPNYSIYLFIALMPWNYFANTIAMGTACVSNGGALLKKVYFPREVLPLATVISNTINYFFSAIIIFIALIFFSPIGLSWFALFLPLIVLIQAIFSLGCILILSALNVYVRDVQYIMNPLMMVWFYATPVLYKSDMVPEKYRFLYDLNPMVKIMDAYRSILYDKTMPSLNWLLAIFIASMIFLWIAYLIFEKLQRRFAEEV